NAVAATAPNFTPVAAVKFDPSISTESPRAAAAGEKPVIFGDTLNWFTLCAGPPGPLTAITPVEAPSGTVTFICVALTGGRVAATPPTVAVFTASKELPFTVTTVPTGPDAGVNDVTFGGRITTNVSVLRPEPDDVVTVTLPLTAVAGTVAWMA